MNQREALRALDAQIMQSLAGAGLADRARYDNAIDCTVCINRTQQMVGDDPSVVIGTRCVAVIQLEEIPEPERGRALTLASGETFVLGDELERDESRAVVVLLRR